jgi:tripartite ATP-independent transporter DctP family solute receptor
MRRFLFISVLVILAFTICMSVYSASDTIIIKAADQVAANHPRAESWLIFKQLVEYRSNGEIKVDVYPTGQLGNQTEILEQVVTGTVQVCASGNFNAASTKLNIYGLPFIIRDVESAYKVIRGPVGEKIAEDAKKNGIKILATGVSSGMRNFTNNKRPITKPEDMKGLKMRTPPQPAIVKTMEALGANPIEVPYADLYMALKTNVADGQENPFTNIVTEHLYEVQKYLTVANYQFGVNPIYANLDWFNSLTPEHQEIIERAAKDMIVFADYLESKKQVESFEILKDKMEINILTEEELQPFIEQTKPVYQYFVDEGFFTWDEIEEVRKAANQ